MNVVKAIFIFDDHSLVVAKADELQIIQMEPGVAAVVAPAGKNESGEDMLRPVIYFPVVVTKPVSKAPVAPATKGRKKK